MVFEPGLPSGHHQVMDIRHAQDIKEYIEHAWEATATQDRKKSMLLRFVTPEGILLTLDRQTGLYSYSWPPLSRIDHPSKRLLAYVKKRRRSRNPISYLWYLFISWFWERESPG
jgi:hypothetical protein